MKKLLSYLTCLTLLVTAAACTSSPEPVSVAESSIPSSVASSQPSTEPSKEEETVPSLLSPLSCFERKCSVQQIVDCREGTIAVVSVPGGDSDADTLTVSVIDTRSDRLLHEFTLPETVEIIGVRKNGQFLIREPESKKLLFYDLNGTKQKEMTFDEPVFVFDQDADCIFLTKHELVRLDFDGKKTTLLSMALKDQADAFDPAEGLAVITCGSVSNRKFSNDETILYQLDSQQSLFRLTDCQAESFWISDGNVVTATTLQSSGPGEELLFHKLIQRYSIPENKWYDGYKTPFDMALTPLNDKGLYAAVNSVFSEVKFPISVYLLNVYSGQYAIIHDLPTSCRYQVSYISDTSMVAVTGTDRKTTETTLYLVDPQKAVWEYQLPDNPYSLDVPQEEEPDYHAGSHLSEQRKKADRLEETYGVTILIGNEIKNYQNDYYFKNVSIEDSATFTTPQAQCTVIDKMLDNLEKVLSTYSKAYFTIYKDFKVEGGLRFLLTDSFISTEGAFEAGAYTAVNGSWYNICIRDMGNNSRETFMTSLHHELWHAAEERIGSLYRSFEDDEWDALNPSGFSYHNNYDEYNDRDDYSPYLLTQGTDPEKICLINRYSSVNEKEDRATLAASFFTEPFDPGSYPNDPHAGSYSDTRSFLLSHPLLQKKYQRMKQYSDKVFGKTYPLFYPDAA